LIGLGAGLNPKNLEQDQCSSQGKSNPNQGEAEKRRILHGRLASG
jgi:hypothetical protein